MSVNPNSASEATVSIRSAPADSCWTLAQLTELARLLVIKFPLGAQTAAMVVSTQTNNLASLDAANAIFVPATLVYARTLTLAAGGGTGPLVFSGWSSEIDATVAFLEVNLFLASNEPGVETATSSEVFVRPNYEITERTASTIRIKVFHATLACSVAIKLAQVPIAPAQS